MPDVAATPAGRGHPRAAKLKENQSTYFRHPRRLITSRSTSAPPSPLSERLPDAGESRAAVAVTVVWMLTCMSTAAALAVACGLWMLSRLLAAPRGGMHPLASIAEVLLFVAVTTGVLCLLLTPLTARVRQTPAPRSITVAAMLIGLAPLVVIVAKLVFIHG
jgi:hypothetical protein